ncbi:hypothetical protein DSO57_1029306 [Entomophthora muscae]|uniref:Uncharacterized protein n=1 Tax=Entomophthora muscae TaxID=34485 RepID=A0ACC2RFY0_9FUNG|nr:hypothetical protein DSO57_1029306 [Entomophthora muscae]
MPASDDYPGASEVPSHSTPTFNHNTTTSQHNASLGARNPTKEYKNSDFGDALQVNPKKLKPNNYGSFDCLIDGFDSLSAAQSSFSMLSPQFLSPRNQEIFFSAKDNLTPTLSGRQPSQNRKEPDSSLPSERVASSQAQDVFKAPLKAQQGSEKFTPQSPRFLSTKDIFDFSIKPVNFNLSTFDLGEYEGAPPLNPMSAFQSQSNSEAVPKQQTAPTKNEDPTNEDSSQSTLNSNSLQSWQIFKQMTRYDELVDERASAEEQTGAFNGNILEQSELMEYSLPPPNPTNSTMPIPGESHIATLPNELITDPNALAEWEEFKRSKDITHETQGPSTIAISNMLPDDDTAHLAKMWSRFKQKTGYCSESAETPAETETLLEHLFTPTTYALQGPATLSTHATPLMPNHTAFSCLRYSENPSDTSTTSHRFRTTV